MRPPKVVLYVDANEDELSRRSFVLETRGFRVVRASTAPQAMAELEREGRGAVSVLLTEYDQLGDATERLMHSAQAFDPEVRTLLTSRLALKENPTTSAAVFLPRAAGMAELLERLRVLSARKRGPQKMPLGVKFVKLSPAVVA